MDLSEQLITGGVFVAAALLPGGVSYLVRDERRRTILVLGLAWGLSTFVASLLICERPRGANGDGWFYLPLLAGILLIPSQTADRPGVWWRGLAHLLAAVLAAAAMWLGAFAIEISCHGFGLM